MTLRELLKKVDHSRIFSYIVMKDSGYACACDRTSLDTATKAYSHVIAELLAIPSSKPSKYPICVKHTIDPFNNEKYIEVCLFNPKYVAPDPSLKPWGGTKGKKIPKGYYDCNADKHNEYFGFGMEKWSKVIDAPIIDEIKLGSHELAAEILWELTFYGWTDKSREEFRSELDKRFKEAKKNL